MSEEEQGQTKQAEEKLEELKKLAVSATTKVQEIEQFFTQFEDLRNRVNDGENGVQKILEDATENRNKIQSIKAEADQKFSEIESLRGSAATKVQEIEQFFTQFEDLRNRVNDGENGVQKILEDATENRNKIQSIKAEADQKFSEIESLRGSAATKVQEIEQFFTQFEDLRTKVLDPENGVQAILNKMETFEEKAIAAKNSAEDEHNQTVKLKIDAESLLSEAKKSNGTIKNLLVESEDLKQDIQKHLELVSDSARSDAISKRKLDLDQETKFWKKSLFGGLVLLAGAFAWIYFDQRGDGFSDWHQIYRYAFTIPVIYFVGLAGRNYANARDLLEKYAFKDVKSVTLSAYTKLLKDEFSEEKEQDIFEFVLETIADINSEPSVKKSKKRTFIFGNKIFNGSISEEEILPTACAEKDKK